MAPKDDAAYSPCDYIDRKLAGRRYLPEEPLTIAPFMAGSLRYILMAPEFSRLPKHLRQRLKHLSFLMHVAAKYDNFPLILSHHFAILDYINSGATSWLDENYLCLAEGNLLSSLEKELAGLDQEQEEMEEEEEEVEDHKELKDLVKIKEEPELDGTHRDGPAPELLSGLDVELSSDEERDDPPKRTKKKAPKMAGKSRRGRKPGPTTTVFCPQCNDDIGLKKGETLRKHIRQQHTTLYTCPHCSISKASGKWMQRHIEKVHCDEKEASILCPTCGLLSPTFASHILHIKTHLTVTCEVCNKMLPDANRLKKHMRNHDQSQEEVCPYCGKIYKHLKAHFYSAHSDHAFTKCKLCDYSSPIPGAVNYHFRRVHNKPQVCPMCEKTVKDVKKHQRRGNCCGPREDRKSFSCPACDKLFTLKQHAERHMKNIHLKAKDVHCPQCSYKTTSRFNLKIHVRRVHEGKELKEECHYCGKQVFNPEYHIKVYHQAEIINGIGLHRTEGNVGIPKLEEVKKVEEPTSEHLS